MCRSTAETLSPAQMLALRGLLEQGLPVHPRPYQILATRLGLTETAVLAQVQCWQDENLFRRFGLVVKHRALGISANAMLVMDIDDATTDTIGEHLAVAPIVTLCYKRRRQLPDWPYNLFCMIHGRDRNQVEIQARELLIQHHLDRFPHALLFSLREFKQRGARYYHHGNDHHD